MKLKKLTASLLAVILVASTFLALPLTVSAAQVNTETVGEITDDGFEYIIKDDNTVTIIEYKGSATELVIPSEIDGHTVTRIGRDAFWNCSSLTSITIPDSVTSIGDSAFWNCSSLTSITIPDSVTSIDNDAFSGCSSLTSITIPDGVTSIGNSAFRDCSSLTNIIIPDGVTSIGYYAFSGCSFLTSITIPDGVTSIGYYAFSGCSFLTSIIIPDSITSIGDGAFRECSSLTNITIPDGVTSIGNAAFRDCSSLTNIEIPDSVTSFGYSVLGGCKNLTTVNVSNANKFYSSINGVLFNKNASVLICYPAGKTDLAYEISEGVTSIGAYAFDSCGSLTSITIPDSVTSIGDSAFWNCSSLTSITIPDSVTSIDNDAFSGCSSLTSITIPDGVTSIDNSVFEDCSSLTSINVNNNNQYYSSLDGVLFDKNKTVLIQYPCGKGDNTYIMPNGVENIGYFAFKENNYLKEIVFNDNLKYIGMRAFLDCENLETVLFNDNLKTIGLCAFKNCKNLESITIPDSVEYIDVGAFALCENLKEVVLPKKLAELPPGLFYKCENLQNVNIPYGVTMISGWKHVTGVADETGAVGTFYGCSKLKTITIPSTVTTIKDGAFSGCNSLTYIFIPKNVDTIDKLSDLGYLYDEIQDNTIKIENFTILGYKGTAAEQYATDNEFTFVDLDNQSYVHNDEETGLSVTAKADAVLNVEKITDADKLNAVNVLVEDKGNLSSLYDISLVMNGEKVQHEGMALVKIPCTDENAKVYHIEDDNTATDMNAVYENGYMVFATEHFSYYALVVPNNTVLGDVNGDGAIDVDDVTLVQKSIAGLESLTNEQIKAADFNGDGELNVDDVTAIQKNIAGLD